jgi:hypothetical protein
MVSCTEPMLRSGRFSTPRQRGYTSDGFELLRSKHREGEICGVSAFVSDVQQTLMDLIFRSSTIHYFTLRFHPAAAIILCSTAPSRYCLLRPATNNAQQSADSQLKLAGASGCVSSTPSSCLRSGVSKRPWASISFAHSKKFLLNMLPPCSTAGPP